MTLCFTLLAQPLIRRAWIRWIVSLAFAVHPIHCEAVASLVGRAELGAALHTLVALLAYRAHLKARGKRRRRTKETKTTTIIKEDDDDDDDEEEEAEAKEEERRIGKKRRRFESLMESTTRAHRNPFENRQSLLSLFIRRVTICCCWSDPLKKIQYRVTSLTSSSSSTSNNGQKPNRQQGGHHHQQLDDEDGEEFERNRWRNDKKKKKKKKLGDLQQQQQQQHNGPTDGRKGCAGAYLWASLTAAGSAILWKETGMVAIPLCAVMELIQQFRVGYRPETPSNRQPSDRSNRHHVQVKAIIFLLIVVQYIYIKSFLSRSRDISREKRTENLIRFLTPSPMTTHFYRCRGLVVRKNVLVHCRSMGTKVKA